MNDVQQVELDIEEARKGIDAMKALNRLRDNKDFQAIIETGYFENNASRLAFLRADPNMQDPDMQDRLVKEIDSIGYLRQYLMTIYGIGRQMENAIAGHEETREELMEEAANG